MIILPFLTLLPLASCWGSLGHRTVAYLAQFHMTNDAADWVARTLNERITDAVIWPDKIRKQKGFEYTKNWHFIDAEDDPPRNCTVNYKRDCTGNSDCVVGAITNHTARLQDKSLGPRDRAESLKFVLHFFGDIHQPLHTEHLALGGNRIPVLFDGTPTNLHAVWDDFIPNKHRGMDNGGNHSDEDEVIAAGSWASGLYYPEELQECVSDAQTCALEWASEANQLLCAYVLRSNVTDQELGEEYFRGAVGIVDRQVQRAGRRLAAWINKLAPPPPYGLPPMQQRQQQQMEL